MTASQSLYIHKTVDINWHMRADDEAQRKKRPQELLSSTLCTNDVQKRLSCRSFTSKSSTMKNNAYPYLDTSKYSKVTQSLLQCLLGLQMQETCGFPLHRKLIDTARFQQQKRDGFFQDSSCRNTNERPKIPVAETQWSIPRFQVQKTRKVISSIRHEFHQCNTKVSMSYTFT